MKADYLVIVDGYLVISQAPESYRLLLEERLNKAKRGKNPGVCDNSDFIKVDPSLVGQTLTVVSDSFDHPIKVLDESGQSIEFEVETPLSFKKWRQPCSENDIPDSLGFEGMTMHEDLHLR